ncbi:uncharacterized protein B4U80_03209, partial [Leptotrombidium deliense]
NKACAITQAVADEATKKIFFLGDRHAIFPTNKTQIDDYCKMIFSNAKTLTEYARCLKPFPKTLIALNVYTYKKLTKKRCADNLWKKSFIKLGTCVNQKNISETFHVCTDKSIAAFEYIVDNFPVKDHLLMTCCVTAFLQSCFHDQGDPCGKDTSDFAFQLLNEPIADGFELVCSTYTNIEACNAKYGDYMQKMIEYLKKPRKPTLSFLAAAMKAGFGDDFLV